MSKEAMKLALEALQKSQRFVEASANAKMLYGWGEQLDTAEDAIKALEEALAKQEQGEPVAWPEPMEQPPLYADEDPAEQARAFRYRVGWNDCLEKCKTAITPQQRKPLTDEQISDLWCKTSNTDFVTADTHEFARAIEAAHGIKE
jgi:hypothetical protein